MSTEVFETLEFSSTKNLGLALQRNDYQDCWLVVLISYVEKNTYTGILNHKFTSLDTAKACYATFQKTLGTK